MRYLLIIVSFFVMVGCSSNDEPAADPEDPVEKNDQTEESNVSISFSEVDVRIQDKEVQVDGSARTDEDTFFYTLEQGDTVIVEETEVSLGEAEGDWKPFDFAETFENYDEDDKEVPVIRLYLKDGDEIINPNYVPIDLVNF